MATPCSRRRGIDPDGIAVLDAERGGILDVDFEVVVVDRSRMRGLFANIVTERKYGLCSAAVNGYSSRE